MRNPVYILSALRSAIGGYGGALKDTSPIDLGIGVASNAIKQSGLNPEQIGHAVYGHVIHTEPKDMYSPRCIAMGAGLPETSPAFQVNRLCGSGLQAVVSACQLIELGDTNAVLAGGVEVMSRSGYLLANHRFGARMGDGSVQDMMMGALHDPFSGVHMGVTAENIAEEYNISREEMDVFAITSQERAIAAAKAGFFKKQIVSVEVKQRRTSVIFDEDEHIKPETSKEALAGLRAAFKKDGAVTAGNASGINDGTASIVLANETVTNSTGKEPMARIVSYGFGGVSPHIMGMGPVPASKMALKKAGLKISDLDLIESNEAFAAQACAVSKALNLPAEIVNPNGGAIALGHPVGATGAILLTKLVHELIRINGKYGMATMCIGGGQGITVIIDAAL
jgi:acetyl-CoA C-acetyltransferase